MQIALTAPQEDFVFHEALYPAMCGGLGSGKTAAAILRLLILMLQSAKNGARVDTLLAMPTYDLLRLRAMPGAEAELSRLGLTYSVNRSDFALQISGVGTMIFRSYDNPERIIAFEVAHSVCDELDTLRKDKAEVVWRKVSERTRQQGPQPNTIGVVTTPDQGVNGFVYEKWVKRKQPGYELVKAATESNPYLPAGYIEQIRANYDPILAEMYLNGDFVSLNQNKVYHFFSRDQHHVSRVITETDTVLHVGIDFNIGGCCAVAFLVEGNKPVAVDEFVSHDTYDLVNNLTRYKGKRVVCYPDASGRAGRTNASASDVQLLQQAGYHVDAPNANPPVRDRINSINALLSYDKMKVNTDTCPNFAHALETQGYTDKNEPEKWNDHPSIDDWSDAGAYFIHRKYPINKPIIFTGISSAM